MATRGDKSQHSWLSGLPGKLTSPFTATTSPSQPVAGTAVQIALFDVSRGQREGSEHEKVLAYHPATSPLHDQVAAVGLWIAMNHFCATFDTDGPCSVLETDNMRWTGLRLTVNVWLLLVVEKSWAGSSTATYALLRSWLTQLQGLMQLLIGDIAQFVKDADGSTAARELQPLLEWKAQQLTGSLAGDPHGALAPALGVPFLFPSHKTALSIQCLSDSLTLAHLSGCIPVQHLLLCYSGHLLYSTLQQPSTLALAHTLLPVLTAVPTYKRSGTPAHSGGVGVGASWWIAAAWHHLPSGFLQLLQQQEGHNYPLVHAQGNRYRLVPFRRGQLSLVMLFTDSADVVDEVASTVLTSCGDMVVSVEALLDEEAPRISNFHQKGFRYMYQDAVLGCTRSTPASKCTKGLTRDTAQLVERVRQEWEDSEEAWPAPPELLRELYVHSASDAWVGIRQRGPRQLLWASEAKGQGESSAAEAAKLVEELAAKQCPLMRQALG